MNEYPADMSRQEERASLHGLTPEEALRALLAVDPEEDGPDDEPGEAHDQEAD